MFIIILSSFTLLYLHMLIDFSSFSLHDYWACWIHWELRPKLREIGLLECAVDSSIAGLYYFGQPNRRVQLSSLYLNNCCWFSFCSSKCMSLRKLTILLDIRGYFDCLGRPLGKLKSNRYKVIVTAKTYHFLLNNFNTFKIWTLLKLTVFSN